MITLAIETSCDETAICLLETRPGQASSEYRILANLIHSQIELHKQYGGVFPIMAKREHAKNIMPLLEAALTEAKIPLVPQEQVSYAVVTEILKEKEADLLERLLASPLVSMMPAPGAIDRIAVTQGPGLEPALWVGVNLARALGVLWNIPIIGVNHMEGHVLGSVLPSSETWDGITGSASDFKKLIPIAYPALALLISGGHTELVFMKNAGGYEIIGRTKDDAVGEAFDKVARMLGLPYPGGPEVSRLAETERKEKNPEKKITFPRPMIHFKDLDFSFSGLKTSVLYLTRELNKTNTDGLTEIQKKEIAREFEDAVAEVLVTKTEKAIEATGAETLIVGGGVIANHHITKLLKSLAEKHSIALLLPPTGVSGDNALMIALAGALSTDKPTTNPIKAAGNLSF